MVNPLVLSVVSIVIALLSAHIILLKNPVKTINRVYYLFAIVYAYWEFVILMMALAANQSLAYNWMRLDLMWPFESALIMHFILLLTDRTKLLANKWIFVWIYGGPIILSMLNLMLPDIFYVQPVFDSVLKIWRYGQISEIAYYLPVLYQFIMLLICLFIGIKSLKQISDLQKKQQIRIVLAGLIIPVLVSLVYEFSNIIGITMPDIPLSSMMVITLFLGFALWRYDLFGIDLFTAMEQIVEIMPDSLVITDTAFNIKNINSAVQKLTGLDKSVLMEASLQNILKDDHEFMILSDIATKKTFETVNDINIKGANGKIVSASVALAEVFAKDRHLIGYIFLFRDFSKRAAMEKQIQDHVKEIEQLNKILIGRELEMIKLKEEIKVLQKVEGY
jgi:PAS domain S-box-containing protein